MKLKAFVEEMVYLLLFISVIILAIFLFVAIQQHDWNSIIRAAEYLAVGFVAGFLSPYFRKK